MNCAEALRVHAFFDGELDASESASVQQHLGGCVSCQTLLADLEHTRGALRLAAQVRVPAQLRSRVDALLDAEPVAATPRAWRTRPFWSGAFAGLGAAAAAVVLVLFVFLPAATVPLVDDLLAAHLRSLTDDRLISVISSEQHTVKPWFAGRADVSPTVGDFPADGFVLAGGRVDALADRRSAVMVYRHGAHLINLFTWPDDAISLPRNTTRHGYHLLFFRIADVAYCVVSDAGWAELTTLKNLVRAQAAAEQRFIPGGE